MVASGRQKEFAAHMAAWIEEQGFGQVVMLCSVDAGVRHDCELDNDAVALAAANVPTLALGLYSSEGDNMSDAEVLADLADTVLGLGAEARIPRWIPPRSWQRLFGPGGDMSAY
ncbi:hypothetical protein H632_c79p4 [Helicosporidium sp. ATCC 50920]|nr:hypothetical protein H632_c79p4 [Helicosporidium sp. ATCC 50920]|eukprot:KDD76881.1 hypothetical protein H632_c79p4 [Helicosporidium sp. ATCC 50920]